MDLRARIAVVVVACALLAPALARADEPWLITVEGGVARAVTSPQSDLFSFGGGAGVAVHRPLAPWLVLGLDLRAVFLADGDTPQDPGLADPDGASTFVAGLALRLRPIARVDVERGVGPWLEIGGGAALTESLVRPALGLGIGWGIAAGPLDVSPFVRWTQIVESEPGIESRDARVVMLGVAVTFGDTREVAEPPPPPPEEPPPPPEEPPPPPPPVDRDPDRDGILDPDDQCPTEPETVNGNDDQDGCPDEGLIELIDDRIVLEERVLFDFERARVKSSARPVLAAIFNLYRQHPEWTRLRIEGHADVRGNTEFNQRLSERRAANVRAALVALGIPGDIIESVGFGAAQPRDPATTEEAHQRNRRVEFVVVARRPADAPAPPPAEGAVTP